MWETVHKGHRKNIDSPKPWCWRRLIHIPWTAKKTNHSVLEETRSECSLKARIMKQNKKIFWSHYETWCIYKKDDDARQSELKDKKRSTVQQLARWSTGSHRNAPAKTVYCSERQSTLEIFYPLISYKNYLMVRWAGKKFNKWINNK